ncbi:lipopolysaccharide transport periplasmic protein LptA [Sulfurimonas aquatica]|uniref:Lipopolysaccharide transport periplasmic protein LptA n=1 Tax=Sulfurimonas aquatica TaxID=2672570 RepID=A0A975GCM9_9BACT|nr:lipopolysaccharide transport periplasmic protein LptA [Sulfurimonas aquatica]QSZ41780.1 lipopolysaccharide transport periplasmic protein LptA [Sulfurimonas aquatica]
MRIIFILFFTTLLFSQELKIKANSFKADESQGISVFDGDVNIVKGNDEINASNLTIYVDKENKPTKFVAIGNVSFKIQTKQNAKYRGSSNKIIYLPLKKEYHFFENVHLVQINEKKEIHGDKVILSIVDGKAYAQGLKKEPVIMIFDIAEEKE